MPPDPPPVDLANRLDQIAAGRTQPGLGARYLGLDHRVVGEPAGAARGLARCQLEEGVEHAAGDAESHTGDADRIEGLLRERIERARLAAQARVLAGAGATVPHERPSCFCNESTSRIAASRPQSADLPKRKGGSLTEGTNCPTSHDAKPKCQEFHKF